MQASIIKASVNDVTAADVLNEAPACGTSLGIGSIRDGGAVEVEINGIGSLRNVLAANAAPTSGAGVSPQ